MIRAIVHLSLWLIVVYFCAMCARPPGVPGHPICLAALSGIGVLLWGAYREAAKCRSLPVFFTYGCIGSLFFIPLFYPDSRSFLAQAMSPSRNERTSDWIFTICCIIGVVYGGVVCRLVAYWRHRRIDDAAANEPRDRCRECGYLLYGLPEPRCPECGTPFELPPRGDRGSETGESDG